MKNNSIIVIGMEERKEVPCLSSESAHGRSSDRGPLIASRQRRKIGALVGRGAAGGSSSSESPISVERESLCVRIYGSSSPSPLPPCLLLRVQRMAASVVDGGWIDGRGRETGSKLG